MTTVAVEISLWIEATLGIPLSPSKVISALRWWGGVEAEEKNVGEYLRMGSLHIVWRIRVMDHETPRRSRVPHWLRVGQGAIKWR